MLLTPGAQIQVAAIDRICHHPGNGEVSVKDPCEHLDGQFWLGLEAHRLGNMGGLTPFPISHQSKGR